jgi:hypothetical protein
MLLLRGNRTHDRDRTTYSNTHIQHEPIEDRDDHSGSQPRTKPADDVVHYDFLRDGDKSEIDDIKGAIDGAPWSIRGMLQDSLKQSVK